MAKLKRIVGVIAVIALFFTVLLSAGGLGEAFALQSSADVAAKVIISSQFPVAGQPLSILITLFNAGPNDALDVVLTTTLSPILQNAEIHFNGSIVSWASPFTIGTIPAGTQADVQIFADIDPASAGQTLLVTAGSSSSTPDPNLANNSSSATRLVGERADISVLKVANPNVFYQGEVVQYLISYQNIGPSNSYNVLIEDNLPAELTGAMVSVNSGQPVPWTGSLSLGTLKPGDSGYITLTATASTAALGIVGNTATISSDTRDANTTDNQSYAEIEVLKVIVKSADVSVLKTPSTDKIETGKSLTYTVTVKNLGADDAEDVLLTDAISPKLTGVEFSADGGATYAPWTGSYNIGLLPVGMSKTILIRGTVSSTTAETITNTAVVSSTTADPDTTNNLFAADVRVIIPERPDVPDTADLTAVRVIACIMAADLPILGLLLFIRKRTEKGERF